MNAKWFTAGAACALAGAVVALAMAALIDSWVTTADDADPPNGRARVRVYTDKGTGCQYLRVRSGGLTPRVDSQSRHICRMENK